MRPHQDASSDNPSATTASQRRAEDPARGDLDDRAVLELACDAARRAILPWFRAKTLPVTNKTPAREGERFDPVTEADRAAEQAMRAVLSRFRPDDGVLGEEFGALEGTTDRVWTLDPIDGTRAFVCGLAHWGVLAALSIRGRAVLGAVDQPYLSERFIGDLRGTPSATLVRGAEDRAALQTRRGVRLTEAVLFATDPVIFAPGVEHARFEAISGQVKLRRFGADCYGYAMLAAGHADLVVEAGLAPYDIRALIPLIEAAGGVVSNWEGGSAHEGGRVVAAGDPALHAEALAILKG